MTKKKSYLDSKTLYMIQGGVDIKDNFISLNGASVQGTDPGKDGIISSCFGAIFRSRNKNVYLEKIFAMCASSQTMGYDFQDDSRSAFCNLFQGCSVLEVPGISSKGVGKIKGFNTICIDLNYWNTKKGLDISGKIAKFTMVYTYITGIAGDAAVEFSKDLDAKDIVMTGNYFVYGGSDGIKVNRGAKIGQGRMISNLFQGQENVTVGFSSSTPGWEMVANSGKISDSRARASIYMNDNNIETPFTQPIFEKINGDTKVKQLKKFRSDVSNQLKYIGNKNIVADVIVSASGISSVTKGNFSIALMKNGKDLILPKASAYSIDSGESFNISLDTQVPLSNGDYIEVVISSSNNTNNASILMKDLIVKLVQY